MDQAMQHISLDKNRQLSPEQDYTFLREKGIEFIQELSGKLWTDHNAHDPGITLLETLCYALTDLGYRTSFPMADLLERGPMDDPAFQQTGLFPSHEILPTCPVTINDFRKLLIKIDGIRNAWLQPLDQTGEVTLYADCKNDKLTFGHLQFLVEKGMLTRREIAVDLHNRLLLFPYAKFITGISLTSFSEHPGFLALSNNLIPGAEFENTDIEQLDVELEALQDDYFPSDTFEIEPGLNAIFDETTKYHTFWIANKEADLLFRGERYTSSSGRNRGIRSVQKNALLETNWKKSQTIDQKFFFTLRAGNNREIGRSPYYDTAEEMRAALAELRSLEFLGGNGSVPTIRRRRLVSEERRWQAQITFSFSNRKPFTDTLEVHTPFSMEEGLPTEVINLLEDPTSELWSDFWKKQERLVKAELKSVHPSGLYDVLLELDIDEELGSLNETTLFYRIPFGQLKGVEVAVDIWDEIDWTRSLQAILNIDPITIIRIPGSSPDTYKGAASLQVGGALTEIKNIQIQILNDKPSSFDPAVEITAEKLVEALQGTDATNEDRALLPVYWKKQQAIEQALSKVDCTLNANRNLCEDFRQIKTVEAEQIAVCVDIEAQSNADLEVLQAKIYLAIEEYLNPSLKYYSLQELLDEGWTADEIFDGPFMPHDFTCGGQAVFTKGGFVKTEELETTQLKEVIYTSDLINILLDFEEVIHIKNLLLRKYDASGNPVGDAQSWCMEITPGKQPKLNISFSKFLFFKNQIPYTPRPTETKETLDWLRASQERRAYVDPHQELDLPKGRYRNLHQYFPIQDDLPRNYGVGKARLPLDVPAQRLAQAKQLKGYLMFFDQILADYLAQLSHAKWLLSPEEITQTYFTKYLDESSITRTEIDFETEYYVSQNGVPALSNPVVRQRLYESEDQFLSRRNRILDHLLARFAEQFTDYTLLLFDLQGNRLKTNADLIADKGQFLKSYPEISRARATAFNYRPENPAELWDSNNISGLEQRIGRLAGINNISRRNLHCPFPMEQVLRTRKVAGDNAWFLVITDDSNKQLFRSIETFPQEEAIEISLEVGPYIRGLGSYQIQPDGRLQIEAAGHTLTHNQVFESVNDAEEVIRSIFIEYDRILKDAETCSSEDSEGILLIEHLLLRPLFPIAEEGLLDVCLPKDCTCCGEEDPYSFRISVVLPYWPGRFDNLNFRSYFERLLRAETPAHIHAKICWIDNEQMHILEDRYRAFLEEKYKRRPDKDVYNHRLKALVEILGQIQTIYPEATLHDCEEDGNEIPVRLGSTSLGI